MPPNSSIEMDSAVRKVVTFYQILDSLHTHRDLTRDSVDVALRWADYCQKFCVESKEKPFFQQLQSFIVAKLSSKPFALTMRPSFDDLQESRTLAIMAVLKNPFVSKDLFSYVLSLVPETSDLEESVLSELTFAAGIVASVREEEWQKLELDVVATFLVDVVSDSMRRTGETRSFLLSKLNDLAKEMSGYDFVIRLLLKLNFTDYLASSDKIDKYDALEYLTEVLIAFVLTILTDEVMKKLDKGPFDQLCVCDSRVLKRYVAWLRGVRLAEDEVPQRLASLERAFHDKGKCSNFFLDFETES